MGVRSNSILAEAPWELHSHGLHGHAEFLASFSPTSMAPKLTAVVPTRALVEQYKTGMVRVALSIPEGVEIDKPLTIRKWLEAFGQSRVSSTD